MYGRPTEPFAVVVHVVYLVVLAVIGYVLARRNFARRLAK